LPLTYDNGHDEIAQHAGGGFYGALSRPRTLTHVANFCERTITACALAGKEQLSCHTSVAQPFSLVSVRACEERVEHTRARALSIPFWTVLVLLSGHKKSVPLPASSNC
jgi:hypothetical protein